MGTNHSDISSTNDTSGSSNMENLSECARVISVLFKVLRQGNHVRNDSPHTDSETAKASGVRTKTAQHRVTGRAANGALHVGVIKAQRSLGKRIQVWGLYNRITVTAKLRPQIIGHDKQDIRAGRRKIGAKPKPKRKKSEANGLHTINSLMTLPPN